MDNICRRSLAVNCRSPTRSLTCRLVEESDPKFAAPVKLRSSAIARKYRICRGSISGCTCSTYRKTSLVMSEKVDFLKGPVLGASAEIAGFGRSFRKLRCFRARLIGLKTPRRPRLETDSYGRPSYEAECAQLDAAGKLNIPHLRGTG
jgi:hypothetical protein